MLLLVIVNAAALAAAGILAGMLRAYGSEKGKNLATKEDIAAITHKIEGVRIQYLTELERLRTDLARGVNRHKARYETELQTYKEIWEKLVPVERATLNLRQRRYSELSPRGPLKITIASF